MENHHPILLKVWQEACRHIEINELARTVAPLLAERMPVQQLAVCRIDAAGGFLETLALGFPGKEGWLRCGRCVCAGPDMQQLMAWCRAGKPGTGREGTALPRALAALVPEDSPAMLAGPLSGSDTRLGVVLLLAIAGAAFDRDHLGLVQQLLEPFSLALENDARIHELAALREAAEADRTALLRRLGRKELGDKIVGAHTGLRVVMERVAQVAHLDVPVLLLGETGSGKELIAREIHRRSPRCTRPFVRVNCGAIPPELIDSQLFGHERGAFTGAVGARKGWFERADGGTLLLDEAGELPPAAQVRLLRILQDGWMERVGGQKPVHVDVRVIAATHRDLPADVAQKKFREDLWYRISTFPIRLPSLRERPQDIPDLACHFAARAATRFGLCRVLPTPAQLELLSTYHWPGNIRELAAVIDRAAILGNGSGLEIATALGVPGPQAPALMPPAAPHAAAPGLDRAVLSMDEVVSAHIQAALQAARGRIAGPGGAAEQLRVNPNTLRARMRKLGIDWRQFKTGAPH